MSDNEVNPLIAIQDEVRAHFGWELQADIDSAKSMKLAFDEAEPFGLSKWNINERNQSLGYLQLKLLKATAVVFVGAAVESQQLEDMVGDGVVFIAADGAVGALPPQADLACIVSDFDGTVHLELAAKNGATIIAHAHGDNMEAWNECVEKWSHFSNPPALVLSHQTPHYFEGMHNWGGFTDGDRALCMAHSLGVNFEDVYLVGYTLSRVGQWSGRTQESLKLEKLQWMAAVVQMLGLEQQID
ncbi:MAG: hypothetical protein O3B00_01045 [archaeon]|nr:hypothetical protein [archaeon]MDA1130072.1 hypothetical protein [archaeon]